MNRPASLLLAPILITLGACSAPEKPNPFVGFYKGFDTCRAEYEVFDARVAAAGVGDAAYHRVPGYPYLRTDRNIASFADELDSAEEVGGWIRRMREFDREAREFEFLNLGMTTQERGIQRDRFLQCSNVLAAVELAEPSAVAQLKEVAHPPDDYSGTARVLGLYPLMVPVLHARIEAHREAVKQEFARPLDELDHPGELHLWRVNPLKDPALGAKGFDEAFADELGLPGLVESQWQSLAELHAPVLWIETASEQDRLGTPVWTEDGIDVDTSRALVNYTIGFARFEDRPVMHITYFAWFRGADTQKPIDSLIWRMTLDIEAQPMVYESIHASGRDHYWYPVQPLQPRENDSTWQQPAIIPQGKVAEGRPTLRLQAGTHSVRRVLNGQSVDAGRVRSYELRRYEDLYTLALPDGGSRSLFGPDGVVPGTEGEDPLWMWASGVRNPGTIKQYGHQTPAYIGRTHFDAPYLLESVFAPPPVRGS